MPKSLALVPAHQRNRPWTKEEITRGLETPRFKPNPQSNPIPKLVERRSWWNGAALTRKEFSERDLATAKEYKANAARLRVSHNDGDELEDFQTIVPYVLREELIFCYEAGAEVWLKQGLAHERQRLAYEVHADTL